MLLGCVTLRIQLGAHDVAPALSNLIMSVYTVVAVTFMFVMDRNKLRNTK
uniref:Uncharacterized protein n=1 Tax=Myoviridae sp. ctu2j3 TaxID=2825197 RepID=A0A8S5UIJ2_9CAUD|nr:MAG TPA: hypothetical protein [Myoviridae sp. ctu2j3]DAF94304.1 MAG TPA: hypothetical protein [Myoviridae sp. ctu2j3]